MEGKKTKLSTYFVISILVIVIDQIVKIWVHNSMVEGTGFRVLGDWFKIHYITNPGMAFGAQIGGEYGKVFLTVFRIIAMFAISWYIRSLYYRHAHKGFLVCISLILGGAVGNLIDSIFYGKLFDLTVKGAPTPWFHGKVVDMFYIDIAQGYYPENWPIVGGNHYSFWPIFNIADAAIFCAVIAILIYQKRFFPEDKKEGYQKFA
ncbi:MAG: lipoprotein signal peptidase [Cytophagales bacterium]|nr:lipoprotein signal peptidase [Cytophagales bacterium]